MAENYENILSHPEAEQLDKDLVEFLAEVDWSKEEIDAELFDPTLPDIPTSYTLSYKDVPFAPLGGVSGLNGHPGNGKTMAFSMLISAALKGDYCGIHCNIENATVLYIDTEMELVNTQRTVRRIHTMNGWPLTERNERLNTICLREVNDATTRWRKILKAIWKFKPTFVFLDGLIDVVEDFNDNKECQKLIYQCMAVASHYNVSMWCLLHLNPGSDKAVGHLGSFLERKATDIFICEKDKDTQNIALTHKKQRLKKAEDIEFKVVDDAKHYGIPEVIGSSEAAETKQKESVEELKSKFLFMGLEIFSYRSLREKLKELLSMGSEKANKLMIEAVEAGVISQLPGNKYQLHIEATSSEQNISFDNSDEEPF